MTGDQARELKAGDYVLWSGSGDGQLGVVTSIGRFGIVIRWNDGRQTSPLFNDMKQFSKADADGRVIED